MKLKLSPNNKEVKTSCLGPKQSSGLSDKCHATKEFGVRRLFDQLYHALYLQVIVYKYTKIRLIYKRLISMFIFIIYTIKTAVMNIVLIVSYKYLSKTLKYKTMN